MSEEDNRKIIEDKSANGRAKLKKTVKFAESTIHCSSSVLAAKIKQVVPTVVCSNRQSSISMLMKKVSEPALKKRSFVAEASRRVTFASLEKPSDSSEVIVENLLDTDKYNDGVNEEVIKKFPVSIQEKRQHRESISIPIKKMSWYTELKGCLIRAYNYIWQAHLWDKHLKIIEGRFGAGVVSYFVFIRWLLTMNVAIFVVNFLFLLLPHVAFKNVRFQHYPNETYNASYVALLNSSNQMSLKERMFAIESDDHPVEKPNVSEVGILKYCSFKYHAELDSSIVSGFLPFVQNILQGTGALESSALLIGHFPNRAVMFYGLNYDIPSAFIWVFIITIILCIVMMLLYTSFGIEEGFLTRYDFQHFPNEIFCAWDYGIRSYKAAALRHESFVIELKSNLSEVRQQKEISGRSLTTWAKLYFIRFLVNILVIIWIVICYIVIYLVGTYQLKEQKAKHLRGVGLRTLLIQYLPALTILVIQNISPFIFDFLVSFEKYHERKKVNISLLRNVFLSLSSIIVLVITFARQITCKPKDICGAGKSPDCNTPRCWEVYVGQQLYKLSVFELFTVIGVFVFWDVPRDIIIQKYNNQYTRLLGRAIFFLPTEVLFPVYGQTILWLGVFYSPVLPSIRIVTLITLFYVKKAKVMKFSEPSQSPYKASRFNTTFVSILMISFLVAMVFHLYVLVSVRPSLGCGPFRSFDSMIDALRGTLESLPFNFLEIWHFIFSGWFFIPACILMCSIIIYYWKYISFLTNMKTRLKAELALLSDDNKFLLERIVDIGKKYK